MLPLHHIDSMAERGLQVVWFSAKVGLVRSIARQQQSVSLSSCEAELYALQAVSQESVAFSQFCQRVYVGLGEMQPKSVPKILLESDELFCIAIACWSRYSEEKQACGDSFGMDEIQNGFWRTRDRSTEQGTENVADLFYKVLEHERLPTSSCKLGF